MSNLVINPQNRHQTFDKFGASGAWWAQVVGGWDEIDEKSGMPKNERIAQLLFDKDEGLGIRIYRYNLGGGSAHSGKGDIPMQCRRTESFDVSNIDYDWSRDKNAVNMMKLACKYGADEVIFFVNSPIERLTKNGKTHQDRAFQCNLSPDNYERFARYCLDCVEHFLGEGIPIKYLSPVNEPVWKWTGGQEGCHYRPTQVWNLFRVFCDEMDKRPMLKDLMLSGAENGDIRYFNKTYCRLLLDDVKIRRRMDSVDTHSYFLTPDYAILKSTIGNRIAFMKRYKQFMDKHYPDISLKTSEWCHMKGGRDFGMKSALEQTKVMMEDMKYLDVTSWQLWIALSNVDYCDGLIYEFDEPRAFRMTKRYYAFGNFSKFIEPGMVRIDSDAGEELDSVCFENDEKTVVVVSNRFKEVKKLDIPFEDAEIYLTSEKFDLEKQTYTKELFMPARSVATIVVKK